MVWVVKVGNIRMLVLGEGKGVAAGWKEEDLAVSGGGMVSLFTAESLVGCMEVGIGERGEVIRRDGGFLRVGGISFKRG